MLRHQKVDSKGKRQILQNLINLELYLYYLFTNILGIIFFSYPEIFTFIGGFLKILEKLCPVNWPVSSSQKLYVYACAQGVRTKLLCAVWAKYKMPGAKYKMPAAKIIFIASGGNIEARKRGKCMWNYHMLGNKIHLIILLNFKK